MGRHGATIKYLSFRMRNQMFKDSRRFEKEKEVTRNKKKMQLHRAKRSGLDMVLQKARRERQKSPSQLRGDGFPQPGELIKAPALVQAPCGGGLPSGSGPLTAKGCFSVQLQCFQMGRQHLNTFLVWCLASLGLGTSAKKALPPSLMEE